jgi:Flp pilus assembly protein TadG
MHCRGQSRRGTAAAELAICLPFLLLLFAVAVDFCRLYNQTQIVQGCTEAAALYAGGYSWPNQDDATAASRAGTTVQPDSDAARLVAAQQAALAEGASLDPPLQSANVQVTVANGQATVVVTYDCTMLTPLLGASRVQTVTRSVTMTKIR